MGEATAFLALVIAFAICAWRNWEAGALFLGIALALNACVVLRNG